MKKIYLVLGLALGVTFTSCSDFLDREPSVELPANTAITTVNDMNNAINGIGYILCGDLGNRFTYGSEFSIYADLLTNDYSVIEDNGQTRSISNYTITNTDYPSEDGYSSYYKALANVNNALASIPNITDGDEATINDLKGQLLAWRGLLHFDLARMFCHIPTTVADPSKALGLVLADKVYGTDYKGTRTDLKTTYDFIIQQFTDAMPLLSKTSATGYFNYYGALALRARAYLYAGEYAKALADANEVINSKAYSLYTKDKYASVWAEEGTSESIFEFLVTSTYNAQRNSPGYYSDIDGYSELAFNTDSKLYKYLKENEKTDCRSKLVVYQNTKKNDGSIDKEGYFPKKYPGRNGEIYVNNPKIIRLSEVYLIAAEASYYISGGAAAAPYINEIEKNRVEGYTDKASVTLDDILFEYEKEMFQENQIAFAYWRNKKSVTSQVNKVVNYDDARTVLPLPKSELDQNKDLQQNDGY